jgi:hypothetical protein
VRILPTDKQLDLDALVRGINASAAEAEVKVRGALLVGRLAEQSAYFFVLAGEYRGEIASFPRILGDELVQQLLAAGLS